MASWLKWPRGGMKAIKSMSCASPIIFPSAMAAHTLPACVVRLPVRLLAMPMHLASQRRKKCRQQAMIVARG